MGINSKKYRFYSSSIVGGGLSIGTGIGLALKRKKIRSKVWIFIGDMTFETGQFEECYKFVKNLLIDLTFQYVFVESFLINIVLLLQLIGISYTFLLNQNHLLALFYKSE